MPVLEFKRSERDFAGSRRRRDVRRARIGVPARFVEVKAKIDNSLVVKEPAAHDPVPGHEARKVRTNMSDSTSVIEIGEVGPTADSRSLESKVRNVSERREWFDVPLRAC